MKELTYGATSATTSTSYIFELGNYLYFSCHIDFSGSTLAGNLDIHASNDNSDWVDTSNQKAVTSAASKLYSLGPVSYKYVKVVWTQSGGTGNWTIYTVLKDSLIIGV